MMIPPAIVLGLAITLILAGFGRVVHRLAGHGPGIRLDRVHLAWVAHIFIWMTFFWWYSYAWTAQFEWRLLVFVFLIFYTITLYLMSVILMPTDLDDVSDFGIYVLSLRSFLLAGAVVAMLTSRRLFQGTFAIVGLVWIFLFFWLNRPVIGVQ